MGVTPKAIRRAQIALIKQAETIASEKKITLSEAVLSIVENPSDPAPVVPAFTRLPVSQSQSKSEKTQMESYFDGPID